LWLQFVLQSDIQYEWDEAKRAETLLDRGVDFASMEYFDWETAIHQAGNRDGETRWSTLGMIGNRLHHVVWTEREQNIRIISLRKANAREAVSYVEQQN
jgi:uncharacterized DUF497 family protein